MDLSVGRGVYQYSRRNTNERGKRTPKGIESSLCRWYLSLRRYFVIRPRRKRRRGDNKFIHGPLPFPPAPPRCVAPISRAELKKFIVSGEESSAGTP